MITTKEIIDKQLKDGREYLYVGGERYRKNDSFLSNGREVKIKDILDATHFMSERGECWHTHMFYDRKCEHWPEHNEKNITQDCTPAAIISDNAEKERDAYRSNVLDTYRPYQIYEAYSSINFYEGMYRYFLGRSREPSTPLSEALLKKGENLIGQLYGPYLFSKQKPDLNSKEQIDNFLKGVIGQQELC